MEELRELYQQAILDHYKSPRNFGKPESYDKEAEGNNPLCGDRVSVYVTVEDNVITDVHFTGSGCAISTASASLMTETIKGKTLAEAEDIFGKFQELLTSERDAVPGSKLEVFAGVREFPARVKCAALAWHALRAALKEKKQVVTTE